MSDLISAYTSVVLFWFSSVNGQLILAALMATRHDHRMTDALGEAIRIAEGAANLARMLGVTPQAIDGWKLRGVPATRVIQVENATGVSRHILRPDIYPENKK